MTEIIRKGRYVYGPRWILYAVCKSTGEVYAIHANEDGTPNEDLMTERSQEQWAIIQGNMDSFTLELERCERGVFLPTIIRCDCGSQVFCEGHTSTCYECGLDYDGNGRVLAPRHMWGEETNEIASDVFLGSDLDYGFAV